MAHRQDAGGASGSDFPRGSVHSAEDDEGAGQSGIYSVIYLLHMAQYERPNSPNILTELTQTADERLFPAELFRQYAGYPAAILQQAARPAFRLRAVLAATLSPSWGIYSGFELGENENVPGSEEYQVRKNTRSRLANGTGREHQKLHHPAE